MYFEEFKTAINKLENKVLKKAPITKVNILKGDTKYAIQFTFDSSKLNQFYTPFVFFVDIDNTEIIDFDD